MKTLFGYSCCARACFDICFNVQVFQENWNKAHEMFREKVGTLESGLYVNVLANHLHELKYSQVLYLVHNGPTSEVPPFNFFFCPLH